MSPDSTLVLAALGGILLLLYLVMRLRLHAFVALLVVSLGVGLATGMQPDAIIDSVTNGMGNTLGFVATVVGLGAMFGKMLEVSGGVDRMANTLLGASVPHAPSGRWR
ncbi:GntT/GntP/DsdX family permease [Cobetia marina]